MDRSLIEDALRDGLSLRATASKLNITLAKLYYYIEKYKIKIRSKSEAQLAFVKKNGHQRCGKKHLLETKENISQKMSSFWDSKQGKAQKERLVLQRRNEWQKKDSKQRSEKLHQLQDSNKPKNGELSKFGLLLKNFLIERGLKIEFCKELVCNHKSDIIIDGKIVLELILPTYIYGEETENKLLARYAKIKEELNNLGYKVLIIEQSSNSLSRSRCQKILNEIKLL